MIYLETKMKTVNIGTEDKPFYVPEMTPEMKQWYKDNQLHLPPWQRSINNLFKKNSIVYEQQRYRSKQCGQTCLAMILGISIDEAIKLLNNKKRSTSLYKDIAVALERQGFEVEKHTGQIEWDEVPNNSIVRVVFPNKAAHFIIKHDDRYYDPAIGIVERYNDYRKITHYIKFRKEW